MKILEATDEPYQMPLCIIIESLQESRALMNALVNILEKNKLPNKGTKARKMLEKLAYEGLLS